MRQKNTDTYFDFIWKHGQVFLQKISLSTGLFMKNELFNHAGAAAFFSLLSVTPVFLLLLIGFNRYLVSYPDVSRNLFAFLQNINGNLSKEFLTHIGLLNIKTTTIGLFGLVNLLWAARAILTSVQRGLGIIFPAEKTRPPIIMNILSFIILFVLLLLAVIATFISMGFHVFQSILPDSMIVHAFLHNVILVIRKLLPFLITFGMVFLTYRFIPPQKPKTQASVIGAFACALSIILLHTIFLKFFNVKQYSVIYGVLGSLILMMVWVYFSFVLFFFFAQYTFVSDKIDVLVLERLYDFQIRHERKIRKTETFLFSNPKYIFEKYAKYYKPGEVLFRERDISTDIYFIYRGSVGIYKEITGERKKIAVLKEGEVFGEMAYLLKEPRTATAIAEEKSILMVIVPAIFEALLLANDTFSRRVIDLMSARLRKTDCAL